MRRIKNELKITGINPVLLFLSVVAVFVLLSVLGGDLLCLSRIGFEVVFPILTSVAVSEWGRTKADDNFDVIAAQSRSFFLWVFYRFIAVFAEAVVFALAAMVLVSALRKEMPVSEMFLLYASPAFFLSTVSMLFGVCFSREHTATLFCGMVWLPALTARGLLRLPGVEYIYLFLRFAGDPNGVWLINKTVLFILSLLLWCVIYLRCRIPGRG